MERFNNLMDDMKFAVTLSLKNKGLFLPALLANIVFFVLGIILVIGIVAIATGSMIRLTAISSDGGFASGTNTALIVGLIIGGLILFLLMALMFLILDIGITGMVIGVTDGEKPSAQLFFSSVKSNLLPVFLTNLGLFFIYMFGFVLIIIPLILYMVTVGLLTGGWGMVLFSAAFQALIGYWVLIKVEDHRGGFESIGVNVRFGRRYFWLLVLIVYLQTSFAAFLPGLLGMLGAAFASLFIGYMVITFFKIVVLLSYRRYREALTDF